MDRQLDALFIHPGSSIIYQNLRNTYSAIETPTWALLLAQSCRRAGYGVSILDCDAEGLSDEEAIKRVKEQNPRYVIFVVYGSEPNQGTTRMASAVPLAQKLKDSYPEYPIVFLGSHTQALPMEVLSLSCVDYICQNEGVYTLRQLLNKDNLLPLTTGLGWKLDGKPRLNKPSLVVPQTEMDNHLPGYAWDLVDLNRYRSHFWQTGYRHEGRTPFAALYTSLGCPFKCNFCWIAGTKIIVANGKNKKIEDVTLDDTLVAYDESTGNVVETKIQRMANREVDSYIRITLTNGKSVGVTEEHPLYRDGKWVEAQNIRIGDKLLMIDWQDKLTISRGSCRKAQYATPEGRQSREDASKRLTAKNPMKVADTAARASTTRKRKIKEGEIVVWTQRSENKERLGNIARETQLSKGSNHPFLDSEVRRRAKESLRTSKRRKEAMAKLRGPNHPCWKGGYAGGIYSPEFNPRLKKKIKLRDNYTCQICSFYGKGGKKATGRRMCVHHINYNKQDSRKCNLILLCNACHLKTNYNRTHWESLLTQKMIDLGHEGCPHYVEVSGIVCVRERTKVYNFQCSPYDNYFANYVLGHNCMINLINRNNNAEGITAADSAGFRYWSAEKSLAEIDRLLDKGVRTLRFSDEMFWLRKAHHEPLIQGLIERNYYDDFNFWAYARVDTVLPGKLARFRRAGIKWLCLGVESGNRNIRREASKGSFEDVDIREVFKEIEEAGIKPMTNVIVGLPGDTYETMQETLDLAIELDAPMFNCYGAMALPGTPLYEQAKKEGKKLPDSYAGYGFLSYECQPMGTDTLTPAEVLKFRDDAFHHYYSRESWQNKIEKMFGVEAKKNVQEMLKIRLKRKLLENQES